MNHSLLSAGRTTHLKILGIGLAAASLFVIVGMTARPTVSEHTVVKADQRPSYAETDAAVRR